MQFYQLSKYAVVIATYRKFTKSCNNDKTRYHKFDWLEITPVHFKFHVLYLTVTTVRVYSTVAIAICLGPKLTHVTMKVSLVTQFSDFNSCYKIS